MGQIARGAFVPVGTRVLYGSEHDFRTRAARFLMDPVLPALMLLIIATLTVAIIVLMVTTVASAVLRAQPELGNVVDPWLGMSATSAAAYEDDFLYPGDALAAERMDAAVFWANSQPGHGSGLDRMGP
jgi:hypothetical protein